MVLLLLCTIEPAKAIVPPSLTAFLSTVSSNTKIRLFRNLPFKMQGEASTTLQNCSACKLLLYGHVQFPIKDRNATSTSSSDTSSDVQATFERALLILAINGTGTWSLDLTSKAGLAPAYAFQLITACSRAILGRASLYLFSEPQKTFYRSVWEQDFTGVHM